MIESNTSRRTLSHKVEAKIVLIFSSMLHGKICLHTHPLEKGTANNRYDSSLQQWSDVPIRGHSKRRGYIFYYTGLLGCKTLITISLPQGAQLNRGASSHNGGLGVCARRLAGLCELLVNLYTEGECQHQTITQCSIAYG